MSGRRRTSSSGSGSRSSRDRRPHDDVDKPSTSQAPHADPSYEELHFESASQERHASTSQAPHASSSQSGRQAIRWSLVGTSLTPGFSSAIGRLVRVMVPPNFRDWHKVPSKLKIQFLSSLQYKPQAGERADIVKKIIKRKSLLPRLLSLSIQAASSAKENTEPNGSESDSNNSSELKTLLERYMANADLQFDDAVQVITQISEGQKSFKDYDSDMMYWINFAVFVNAWNLSSHYPGLRDDSGSSSWRIVNSLVENSVTELLRSAKPILTNPESNFPDLVEIVTESISWHSLVIQSRLRSLLPSSKKKKRSCASDQHNLPQLREIRGSIQCLVDALESVLKCVSDQIGRSEDECVDVLLSHLRVEGDGGPGRVLRSLELTDSTDAELGERISGALQSWSSASVVRKMVGAQRTMLLEFYGICESKLKLLDSLKQLV